MNTVQRVTKNVLALFAAQVVGGLAGFFLTTFVARKLGDVAFGQYSFAFAFVGLFSFFLDLGFGTVLARDVARDNSLASKYAGNIMAIKVLMSFLILAVIVISINIMGYPREVSVAVLILGLYIGFSAVADIFRFVFRAFQKMEYEAIVVVIRQILIVSLGLVAISLGYGLIGIVCAFVVGSLVDLLLGLAICGKKFAIPRIEIDLEFWKKITRLALPIGFIYLASSLYLRIDTVMLSMMKGDDVVGWYNAAYYLVYAFRPFPAMFMNAVLPLLSRYSVSSQVSLKDGYERSVRYLLILGLPIATGVCLLANRFILLSSGDQYTKSIPALQFLAWNILFFFLYEPLYVTLITINKQGQAAVIAGVGAVLNIILNLILIPPLSYIGAAIAANVTQMMLCVTSFYAVSRYLHRVPLHRIIAKPLVASLAMAILLYLGREFNLPLLILSGAALYVTVLFLLKGFSPEDIRMAGMAARVLKIGK